jgi:hypothetical protein
MAISIWGPQFTALWAALLALGNSGLALRAVQSGKKVPFIVSLATTAFLIYLTISYLPNLPIS